MKQQIRKGLFETNSSSIHSLVIGNNGEDIYANLPTEIYFGAGEFGWENEVYTDTETKACYLYTAIVLNSLVDELVPKIKNILDKWNIKYMFKETVKEEDYKGEFFYTFKDTKRYDYYIDHVYDAKDFCIQVCNDESLLMNFLFSNESFVETGNDNQDDEDFIHHKYPINVMLDYEKGN